jgi:ribonuclease HII
VLRQAERIVGVDEVGRGSLAGPVVVCAAAFSSIPDDSDVQDSKLLTPHRREQVAGRLRTSCDAWAACEIWVEVIDRCNILEATRMAMHSAARALLAPRTVVVTDHVDPGCLGCQVLSPKKADREFFAVAAASILAKVHRDALMAELGAADPRWGWAQNKGYGTEFHRQALQELGPSVYHRRSYHWSPVLP